MACSPVEIKTRNGVYHIVNDGETLWRICYTYKANMRSVCLFNNIKNPEKIRVGQKLFIPGADSVRTVKIVRKEGKGAPPNRKPAKKRTVLKFRWPVRGQVTSWFGLRKGRRHEGIDIAASKGTPIHAAERGKVVYSAAGIKGYGNMIIIEHREQFSTVYAHNSRNRVHVDDSVIKGQIIGNVGNTGRSKGSHLHFEIRKKVKAVDPMNYLP